MKTLTLILTYSTILSFCVNTRSQSDKCYEEIKKGRFELTTVRKDGYYVIRKKNKQIEVFNNGNSKVISKVTWLSPKIFNLTTIKLVNAPESWTNVLGSVIRVTIIECNGDTFTCRVEQEGKSTLILEYKTIS